MNFVSLKAIRSSYPDMMLKNEVSSSELVEAIPFSRFDTGLNMSYDDEASRVLRKDHWRVLDTFKFYYGSGETLQWVVVPAGFLTDGASIPRLFWGVIAPWGSHGQAAALHDYLIEYGVVYQNNVRVHISRRQADVIFNEALRAAQVPTWRRRLMYLAVRLWTMLGKRQSTAYRVTKRRLEADWVIEHTDLSSESSAS